MNFTVTILGSGAAIPTPDRKPTAHLVEVRNRLLLLDCGEGTQMQLRQTGLRTQRISHIFISHLHGDHYFGLIGLINTFHLLGRKPDLHLYAVPQLKELIDMQLAFSGTVLSYPLIFHAIDPCSPGRIMEDDKISVSVIPLNHRVPTCGFLITEKPEKRNIRKEFARKVKVPVPVYEMIRNGEDYTGEDGTFYPNHEITYESRAPRSYAYCTDTAYFEPVVPLIKNCDLLYHEATFMEDKAADARAKFHSTAREAATIALKAGARKLLIGHFSARYSDTAGLLNEARQVFPETIVAEDGMTIQV